MARPVRGRRGFAFSKAIGAGGPSCAQQRWLWHAIDHVTGVVLAYAFGSRADEVFLQLQKLLKPLGLVHFDTAAAGVYDRDLPATGHTVGKIHTPQIERKHLTLRPRIKRLARKQSVSPNPSSCTTPCLASL